MFIHLHSSTSNSRPGTFILDIIASGSLGAFRGIAKATANKKYGNWYRWCTFLKHLGITDEFLAGTPQ